MAVSRIQRPYDMTSPLRNGGIPMACKNIFKIAMVLAVFLTMGCKKKDDDNVAPKQDEPAKSAPAEKSFCETHPIEPLYETQDHHLVREVEYTHVRSCKGFEISASWETVKPPTKSISLPKKICKALVRPNTYVGMVNMTNCKNLGFVTSFGENCNIVIDQSSGLFYASVEDGANDINFYIHTCPTANMQECQGNKLNEKYLVDAYSMRINVTYEEIHRPGEVYRDTPDCSKK